MKYFITLVCTLLLFTTHYFVFKSGFSIGYSDRDDEDGKAFRDARLRPDFTTGLHIGQLMSAPTCDIDMPQGSIIKGVVFHNPVRIRRGVFSSVIGCSFETAQADYRDCFGFSLENGEYFTVSYCHLQMFTLPPPIPFLQ